MENIQDGKKHRRCDEDDEKQEVTHYPKMEWDMSGEMNNARIYAV